MNCKQIIFKESEKFYCRNIQEGLLTHTRRAGKTSARYDPTVNRQRWEGIQYEETGKQTEKKKKIKHKHVRVLAAWCRWGSSASPPRPPNPTADCDGGLSAKTCPILCDPLDCSPPGSSVHGISQARILEWIAISFSGDVPNPGIEPVLAGRFFTTEPIKRKIRQSKIQGVDGTGYKM